MYNMTEVVELKSPSLESVKEPRGVSIRVLSSNCGGLYTTYECTMARVKVNLTILRITEDFIISPSTHSKLYNIQYK